MKRKEGLYINLTDIWGSMLNRRAKAYSQKVIESLQISCGDVITEIGSGGGYFTCEFAKKVGKDGKVFAVDINANLLNYIEKRLKKHNINNIITIEADETGFVLPNENCNLIFLRNVFHHIDNAEDYFRNIRNILKPNGKIVIIEWLPNKNGIYTMHAGHSTSETEICSVMEKAGFQRIHSFDFMTNQSFNVFDVIP